MNLDFLKVLKNKLSQIGSFLLLNYEKDSKKIIIGSCCSSLLFFIILISSFMLMGASEEEQDDSPKTIDTTDTMESFVTIAVNESNQCCR